MGKMKITYKKYQQTDTCAPHSMRCPARLPDASKFKSSGFQPNLIRNSLVIVDSEVVNVVDGCLIITCDQPVYKWA